MSSECGAVAPMLHMRVWFAVQCLKLNMQCELTQFFVWHFFHRFHRLATLVIYHPLIVSFPAKNFPFLQVFPTVVSVTLAACAWPTAGHVRHIAATCLSLQQQLRAVSNGIFYTADGNVFLLLIYLVNILPDKYFTKDIWVAKLYMAICFNFFWGTVIFRT